MSKGFFAWLLLCLGVMVLNMYTADAASLETLMMPGKLIQGHAKFEGQCKKCHERFSKRGQSKLCLDCHKKVTADINSHKGYHGRIRDINTTECKLCHTEHKGRRADIVMLDKETFDHGATDFPLRGAHINVRCASCHKPRLKYREAPSGCIDCHKKDDPHKGHLGSDCAKCHTVRAWKSVEFNHDKTDFPLKGKHREATCSSCHPNERYKQVPKTCVACHKINDAHGGRYGAKCHTCHSAKDWKHITFDHDRDTKFKLEGRHRKVGCDSCHKGKLYEEKLGGNCYDCHKNDDYHKGRYGKKCQSCHSPEKWTKSEFDHDRKTDFPLRGRHARVDCQACHRGDVFKEKLKTNCSACHRQDDPHHGQEGKLCERCHNEQGWGRKVVFDHDLTRFPLIGLHATAPCEECHLSAKFKEASLDCVACHRADDKHKKRLGPSCGQCHNPNGWERWRFDHDTQTDYKLDGKHKGLDCKACHRTPVETHIRLSKACVSCHQRDDIHVGRFGPHCDRCHVTESFKKVTLLR